MMNSNRITVIFSSLFLCMSATQIAAVAGASEARVGGLAGNPMVIDTVDIVEFPGLVAADGNSLFLNVYQAAPYGNAGFLVGDRVVGGAWINRQARWNDLEKTDEIFSFNLPTIHDILDLYLGFGFGFGLRLSVSAGLEAFDSRYVATSSNLYADGEAAFGVEIAPGYTIERARYHGDIGLGVSLSHFTVSTNGELAYVPTYIPSFFLRHRSLIGPRDKMANFVIDFYFTRRAYGAKAKGTTVDEGNFGHLSSTLVVGPKLNLPSDFTVWGGLKLEVEYLSGEMKVGQPNGGVVEARQPRLLGAGAPGAVLSAELMLLDFLFIRAGVDYDLYWTIVSTPDVGDTDGDGDRTESAARSRTMGHRFSWSTGLGLALSDFEVDGTVTQSFWFDGPDAIGGRAPGFLGMLSAAYMF